MDTEALRLILWIVAGSLMVAGVVAVGLALLFDKSASQSELAKPAPKRAAQAAIVVTKAPVEPVDEKALAGRKAAYRQGIYVLVGLAVLTVVEFAVAFLLEGSVVFLFVLALAKAGVILQYYMHLDRVWSEEEAH
jgi:heme/copper-type cytochrome/quinol oxidase subunit 4